MLHNISHASLRLLRATAYIFNKEHLTLLCFRLTFHHSRYSLFVWSVGGLTKFFTSSARGRAAPLRWVANKNDANESCNIWRIYSFETCRPNVISRPIPGGAMEPRWWGLACNRCRSKSPPMFFVFVLLGKSFKLVVTHDKHFILGP